MPADVRLRIDGKDFGGWQRVRIVRSLEAIAGTFELGLTEAWPDSEGPRPVRQGQECAVLLDGEPVITGHVDTVERSYDASRRETTVRGRDATGDLVDCAAVVDGGKWKGRNLEWIAREVCKPFGISVSVETDVGAAFQEANAEPGESAFETLERLARYRGVLLVSDGRGGLVLARPSAERVGTVLERGVNVLAAESALSMAGLHSRYIVKGQAQANQWTTGTAATEPQGEATDDTVGRHRPLVIVAEDAADLAGMKARADWERGVRIGRSARLTVTVQGWRHANGLWAPNRRVALRDDWLDIDEELLIAETAHALDERGTRTELTLVRPGAFEVQPAKEPTSTSFWGAV